MIYIKYCYLQAMPFQPATVYSVSLLPPAPVFVTGNVDSGESLSKEGERSQKKYLKIHFEEKIRSFSRNLPPRSRKGSVNQQWRVKSFKSQQWRLKTHHHFPAKFGNKYGQLLLYHSLEFSS